jgi:hypothetical protein
MTRINEDATRKVNWQHPPKLDHAGPVRSQKAHACSRCKEGGRVRRPRPPVLRRRLHSTRAPSSAARSTRRQGFSGLRVLPMFVEVGKIEIHEVYPASPPSRAPRVDCRLMAWCHRCCPTIALPAPVSGVSAHAARAMEGGNRSESDPWRRFPQPEGCQLVDLAGTPNSVC